MSVCRSRSRMSSCSSACSFYLWLVAYRQLRLTGFPRLTGSVQAAMQKNNDVHPLHWVRQTCFQLIYHSHPFKPGVRYPPYDLIGLSDGHNNTGLIFEQHSGTHHFLSSCRVSLTFAQRQSPGLWSRSSPVTVQAEPLLCRGSFDIKRFFTSNESLLHLCALI